jgi:hypothetical protein
MSAIAPWAAREHVTDLETSRQLFVTNTPSMLP